MKLYFLQWKPFQLCDSMLFGQVILTAFFRALSKYFSGKDGSASLEEIGRYAVAVVGKNFWGLAPHYLGGNNG